MSSFENQNNEMPKSKQDIINEKMSEAEKLQTEIDNLLGSLPDGETKNSLIEKTRALKEKNDEIINLLAVEDASDIKQ